LLGLAVQWHVKLNYLRKHLLSKENSLFQQGAKCMYHGRVQNDSDDVFDILCTYSLHDDVWYSLDLRF